MTVIDAAMTVIAREGVDGATTRKFADEARAPLATLHYCFQAKEKPLWAVFEHLAEVVRSDLAQANASDHAAIALVSRLLRETVQWAIENPAPNRAQIEIWLWARRNTRSSRRESTTCSSRPGRIASGRRWLRFPRSTSRP
ncbi:TetR family transcriptional regulator [Streptomyces sp. NPDC051320]|uniref:TetR/AcrR family transcriptional regulator n=1 Tax=Streptomyces sp. NPDC051320 TaxID=3154644 RepID=UPI00343CA495